LEICPRLAVRSRSTSGQATDPNGRASPYRPADTNGVPALTYAGVRLMIPPRCSAAAVSSLLLQAVPRAVACLIWIPVWIPMRGRWQRGEDGLERLAAFGPYRMQRFGKGKGEGADGTGSDDPGGATGFSPPNQGPCPLFCTHFVALACYGLLWPWHAAACKRGT
jgi:hypothetical protein